MASVCSRPRFWFLAVARISCCFLLVMLPSPCCSSPDAGGEGAAVAAATVDIVARALLCFNDRYIYSGCQGSFRLGPEGSLAVPPGSADAFCGGPCLAETELVLHCIDGIMSNFRFYNGASAADVRFALDQGCGHTGLRGDFGVLERIGADEGNYGHGHFYGRAGDGARRRSIKNLAAVPLLLSAAAAILVWT